MQRGEVMVAVPANIIDFTAEQILGIKADNPEALFQPDLAAVTRDFRALAKKWHPDINKDPQASDVQKHIFELREKAEEKLACGAWQEAGYFTCRLTNGKKFRVRADASHKFELGTMHISPTTITYVVDRAYADLFRNAVDVCRSLKFADDKKHKLFGDAERTMKEVYAPRLPTEFKTYETADSLILTVRKGTEDILLRDLKAHLPKKNLDRHVAWMMSRLHELTRYLDYAGIAHNGIALDTVFISPCNHTASLFGGWWYATPLNKTIKAVSAVAEEFLSEKTLDTGKPDPKVDLEMMRAVGRELLGDRGGTSLAFKKAAPPGMLDYLRLPSSGDAQKDLTHWYDDVLQKSFGARRFIELKVKYSDVYQPK